jgi:pimeloyl-ACP methyl ester carboxylesterase
MRLTARSTRGNDGLPRNFCSEGSTPDLRPRPSGAEPAIILMHGFPDNVHLYDRLTPYLSPPRRVVLFDFLGWGSSDKPSGYHYTNDNQVGDLDAVITRLGLGQVVLVAHDASGPPAIDWALAHAVSSSKATVAIYIFCAWKRRRQRRRDGPDQEIHPAISSPAPSRRQTARLLMGRSAARNRKRE